MGAYRGSVCRWGAVCAAPPGQATSTCCSLQGRLDDSGCLGINRMCRKCDFLCIRSPFFDSTNVGARCCSRCWAAREYIPSTTGKF